MKRKRRKHFRPDDRDSLETRPDNEKSNSRNHVDYSERPPFFRSLFSWDSLALWMLGGFALAWVLLGRPDLKKLPNPARGIIVTAAITTVAVRSYFFGRWSASWRGDHSDQVVRRQRLSSVISFCDVLLATILIASLLYYVGAVSYVAIAMQRAWPYLSERVSYALSTVLNWIISGVVGNYAFHLLKTKLHKK